MQWALVGRPAAAEIGDQAAEAEWGPPLGVRLRWNELQLEDEKACCRQVSVLAWSPMCWKACSQSQPGHCKLTCPNPACDRCSVSCCTFAL